MSKDRPRIDIPEQQARKLREFASRDGVSMKSLIREGLDMVIEKYSEPNPCPYTHAHTRHWCGYEECRE